MRCPVCGRRIVQIGIDGNVKIRTNILAFSKSGTGAVVVCRHCKSDVDIDILLGDRLQKAITPRLVLKKR